MLNLQPRTAIFSYMAQHKTVNLIFFMKLFWLARFSSMVFVDDKSSDDFRM